MIERRNGVNGISCAIERLGRRMGSSSRPAAKKIWATDKNAAHFYELTTIPPLLRLNKGHSAGVWAKRAQSDG